MSLRFRAYILLSFLSCKITKNAPMSQYLKRMISNYLLNRMFLLVFYMQLVRPKVVAMAVRMEIIMLMTIFQVSFLLFIGKRIRNSLTPVPLSEGEGRRMLCGCFGCHVNEIDKWFLEAYHSPLPRRGARG